MTRATLFFLHSLGASAREWDGVVARLGGSFDCVALDLPGFGGRVADRRTSVAAMLDWLSAEVRVRDPGSWMPVGHSMGGKLATVLVARAEAGEPGLAALAGVVLLAASPPGPEPMAEERRAEMLSWFADGPASEEHARQFVDANVAGALPRGEMEQAMSDVRRSAPQAWFDWLGRGSREDWRSHVGTIAAPALVVAGAEDGDLGAENQRNLNVPLFRDARSEVVPNAAHLLPYEAPDQVAALIAGHWERVRERALPGRFARLLGSDRVSARTRRALLGRMDDPGPDEAGCLSDAQVTTLRAVLERVLPGRRDGADLARRLDVALASGPGDGWRFAELPPDAEAWRRGLDTLDAIAGGFADLAPDAQDAVLHRIERGEAAPLAGGDAALSPEQMKLWFEDLRADAVRTWLSHPKALDRIGYDGFANGGDGAFFQGYAITAADDLEPWQLRFKGDRA